MKHTITFFAVLMMATAMSQSVKAYDFSAVAPTGQTLYYNIVDGNAQVTSQNNFNPYYYTHPTGALEIPDSVTDGSTSYAVTSIGYHAFYCCSGLTSVTIPNSVTTIGDGAFSGCSGLTSVTIGNSVTSIGNYAFSSCSGLTSVTIGNSVTSIGNYAFSSCSGLTSVTIGNSVNSIGNYAFSYCSSLTSAVYNSTLFAYLPQSYNGSYAIPSEITTICGGAFSGCSGLTSVSIPNSVTTIGNEAFQNCSGLTSVTIPNSVTYIGGRAFLNCSGLTSVTIPNSVTYIGGNAFYGCSSLTSAVYNSTLFAHLPQSYNGSYAIPSGITTICEGAFCNCSGLTSVTIPNSVTTIGNGAFQNCSGLTSVTIPNSVTSISNYAFYNCSGLTSVTIPNSVTYISGSAFYYCSSLTSVTIPNSVSSIGNCAFQNCSSLTSITIPNSVTSIGGYAFSSCTNLTNLIIPNTVDTIGNYAFSGVRHIEYHGSATGAPWGARSMNGVMEGDFIYTDSARTILRLYIGNDSNAVIPSQVRIIGDSAFFKCDWMTSVVIPDSVTLIGRYSFAKCSTLTSVSLPPSLTSIGNSAFWATGLTSVAIPNMVTIVDTDAFFGCNSLVSITIGSSVSQIGWRALYNCTALTEITSLAFVAPILGINVFHGVPSGAVIHIPCGSLSSYISRWSYFTNFVENNYMFDVNTADSTKGQVTIITEPTCQNPSATIVAEAADGYTFDHWSNGVADNPYTLNVSSDTALTAYFMINIIPQICMVSVQDNHNVVMWDKENDGVIATYNIYREGNITGEYDLIWSQTFDSMSVWIDTASRPSTRSYRYRMTATDIYGYESAPSEVHKTMHLTINRGMGNSWNLAWTEYEGADFVTYMIYRGNHWGTLQMIDQMPVGGNTTYTDENALGGNIYYQVVVVKASPCTPTKSEALIRSNIASYEEEPPEGIGDIDEDGIGIYAHGGQIIVTGAEGETVQVFDIMGRPVSDHALPAGVYMVKIGNHPARKVVVIK